MQKEDCELVRTDSTLVTYMYHSKKPGIRLSPLGRIRRIERWQNELIKEFKKYNE